MNYEWMWKEFRAHMEDAREFGDEYTVDEILVDLDALERME